MSPEAKSHSPSAAAPAPAAASAAVPASAGALRKFESAYEEFVKKLGTVCEDTASRISEAQVKYLDRRTAANDDPAEAPKLHESAWQEYVRAVRAAWDHSQRGYTDAYHGFLHSHREAWSAADPAKLSPPEVGMISTSAHLAGAYAHAVIGEWGTIAYAGVPPAVLAVAGGSGSH